MYPARPPRALPTTSSLFFTETTFSRQKPFFCRMTAQLRLSVKGAGKSGVLRKRGQSTPACNHLCGPLWSSTEGSPCA